MIKKYRKKPIVIEAVPWAGDNLVLISEWMKPQKVEVASMSIILIPTLEGVMEAHLGDWIIKGVNGEFYPCKPDIFLKTYEDASIEEPNWRELLLAYMGHVGSCEGITFLDAGSAGFSGLTKEQMDQLIALRDDWPS